MVRWVLGAVVVILGLITISAAVLFFLVPPSAIERHILASVARATDTEISSGGPPEITLFPQISMKLRNLRMQPRSGQRPLLSAREVDAEISWLPLITMWTVSVDKLHFVDPVVDLTEPAEAPLERAETPLRKASYTAPGLSIGEVSVENGSVQGLPGDLRVDGVRSKVQSVDFEKPLPVAFNLILNGHPVTGSVRFKDPAKLKSGEAFAFTSNLSGENGRAEFDGVADVGGDTMLDGKAKIETPDLVAASNWLGLPVEQREKVRPASFAGGIKISDGAAEISDAAIQLGEVGFTLGARLKTDADPPSVHDITLSNIDPNMFVELPEGITVGEVTAKIDEFSLGKPLKSDLEFKLNEEPLTGTATLSEVAQLTRPGPVRLNASFAIPGGNLEFFGDFPSPAEGGPLESAGAAKAVQGILKVKTASARRTAAWLGVEVPQGQGFNSLKFDGDVSIAADRVRLAQMKAKLDETAASGEVVVDMSGERRSVSGKLVLDKLDTGLYFGSGSAGNKAAGGRQVAQLESVAPAPYQLLLDPIKPSLEAYVAGSATGGPLKKELQLESRLASSGSVWSKDDLGLDALKGGKTDVDLDLTVGDLSYGSLALGKSVLGAKLAGDRLDLDIREAEPLEGKISGTVGIDASGDEPSIAVDLKAQGVRVENVLRQAEQRDVIRGALTGDAKLSASGKSQAALISSLSGTAHGVVKDGAVVGYDVRRIVRPFANRSYNPNHTTPFDALEGDFEIANGLAKNPNIALNGPAIVVRADGEVDLKTREIAYRTKLSLVPPPSNFSLPLKILGTWRNVKAALDWARLATQWTGPSPFDGLESVKKPNLGDKELESLVLELITKSGGKGGIPPQGAALMRELTGTGR